MNDDLKNKPEDFWKKKLNDDEYEVLRNKGTEAPFSGEYVDNHQKGMYRCKACGAELFSSDQKFDSGTGWPSFTDFTKAGNVTTQSDDSYGMRRTEILCKNCGGHLGHVFDDGPKEQGGKRYCVNSCSLQFEGDGQ